MREYFYDERGSKIFTSKISQSDKEKNEGRLAWKYDTVNLLPDNHPYKLKAPKEG